MGQGEVGGCTRRVQTAWPSLGSTVESDLVSTGWDTSITFGIKWIWLELPRAHDDIIVPPP